MTAAKSASSRSRLFRPRSWPIAVKLSIELVLAALVPLILAMWIIASQSRDRLAQHAADNVELLAGVTAARIDQLLIDTNRVATMLCNDELIQRFCAAEAADRDQFVSAVQRKIELAVASNPDFASILIDGADGICIASTSADMVGVDYNFREYFRKARAGERHISSMLVGKTSNVPGVYFSAPVVGPDRATSTEQIATTPNSAVIDPTMIRGVVVLKLDGRSIWKLIDSVRVGGRGHAILSNADGVVTAHPDKRFLYHSFAPLTPGQITAIDPLTQWNVETIASLDLPELMAPLTSARSRGTQMYTQSLGEELDREHWIAGYAPVHERDWFVSIVQPMEEFNQPITAMLRQQVWIVLAVGLLAMALALLQARRTVRPVLAVTSAANELANGDFGIRAPKMSDDEIGQLAQAFNDMVPQLKERVDMQQSLKVAMEVQQSLLPASDPKPPGLDVAGRSRYCDATGGDYFDFVDISRVSDSTTLIALGDVMGHGVASALLMATARAALRAQAMEDGTLSGLMTKVNRVLAADARHGRFMTMSLLVINPQAGAVRWASAGHDPIIVYHTQQQRFDELDGGGFPLGVSYEGEYEEYRRDGIAVGDVLLIGTDGIWELRSHQGEMYGKERLRQFIRAHAHMHASEIALELQNELRDYSGDGSVQDDVTFVVVRVTDINQ
jgi:serine phosphatase RsbU (regulator of sigma subunit)